MGAADELRVCEPSPAVNGPMMYVAFSDEGLHINYSKDAERMPEEVGVD